MTKCKHCAHDRPSHNDEFGRMVLTCLCKKFEAEEPSFDEWLRQMFGQTCRYKRGYLNLGLKDIEVWIPDD